MTALAAPSIISRKPLPIKKPLAFKPLRRKSMSAVAAFVYADGLVFCADTKISTDIQTNETKLFYESYGEGKCATVFAVSGNDLDFAKSAITSCEDAVAKVDINTASIESIRKAIQSALAKFYREQIFPHPDRALGVISFQFLIGVWLRGETRLFISHETVLNPVTEYESIGTGAYLVKHYAKQFQTAGAGTMDLADAALIAWYAVESAAKYDPACGGEPEILIFRNNGDMSNAYDTAAYPDSRLAESFQTETWRLLRELAHCKQGDTNAAMESHFERMRKLNSAAEYWPPAKARLSRPTL